MIIIRKVIQKTGVIILPIILSGLGIFLFVQKNDNLLIDMIDVGQGDGIFLMLDNDISIMFDGGSSSKKNIGEYILKPVFNARGKNKINYWFISHSDNDHISGLVEILNQYSKLKIKVENIVIPRFRFDDEKYEDIIRLCNINNIKIYEMQRGDSIRIKDKIMFDCFYPFGHNLKNPNDESCVIMLNYEEFQMLFTGDIGMEEDKELIEYYNKKYANEDLEILKVAHHGSKFSTSEKLLDELSPNVAVISAGDKNTYGHPNTELIRRLDERRIFHYCTKDLGHIEIRTDGKKMKIDCGSIK